MSEVVRGERKRDRKIVMRQLIGREREKVIGSHAYLLPIDSSYPFVILLLGTVTFSADSTHSKNRT